jgi:hypothetical protein
MQLAHSALQVSLTLWESLGEGRGHSTRDYHVFAVARAPVPVSVYSNLVWSNWKTDGQQQH